MMVIAVGDRMPVGSFKTMGDEGPVALETGELFGDKRVVLFGVPGAFTPGCSRTHLPGYVENADSIRAKGFDTIACIAVNDAWVMHAWGEGAGATGKVAMLADGSADYAKAMGLELDLNHVGMGMRCRRFSIVVQDGVVESINIDERGIDLTAAENTCGL
jgi:peroxiredoxin